MPRKDPEARKQYNHEQYEKNRDKRDNRIENLMFVTYAEHNRLHVKDRPIWNNGMTRETSSKWDAAILKRMETHKRNYQKKCEDAACLYSQGLRVVQIADILNICSRQVYSRLEYAGIDVHATIEVGEGQEGSDA